MATATTTSTTEEIHKVGIDEVVLVLHHGNTSELCLEGLDCIYGGKT